MLAFGIEYSVQTGWKKVIMMDITEMGCICVLRRTQKNMYMIQQTRMGEYIVKQLTPQAYDLFLCITRSKLNVQLREKGTTLLALNQEKLYNRSAPGESLPLPEQLMSC